MMWRNGLLTSLVLAALATQGHRFAIADEPPETAPFSQRIDWHLQRRFDELGIKPAPRAEDAEFLRRVYLDLTGVIPSVAEARAFLRDSSSDKRERLIDHLLASPNHATHMANTWRQIMVPGGLSPEQIQSVVGVQNWLRDQFAFQARYDRMVADLLVATGGGDRGPALFYTATGLEPEKLASTSARIFLGIQIECAQCHDHPFDRWTMEDFWAYAAFFAQLQRGGDVPNPATMNLVDLTEGEVTLPDSEQVVPPRYPGATAVPPEQPGTRRMLLAVWMASRENPYLARAAVNRFWAQMFGRGLVDPVDDLRPDNPASHPVLLDELAVYFVRSGFDVRQLLRTIANTEAYQRSSRQGAEDQVPPELFARMAIKTLNDEQLYDSLNRALLRRPELQAFGGRLFDPQRLAFVARRQTPSESATQYEAGVPQALSLMNGADVTRETTAEQSGLLQALQLPLMSDQDRLETLFLATLSRPPDYDEVSEYLPFISDVQDETERRAVLSDILWALINSAEFALNH